MTSQGWKSSVKTIMDNWDTSSGVSPPGCRPYVDGVGEAAPAPSVVPEEPPQPPPGRRGDPDPELVPSARHVEEEAPLAALVFRHRVHWFLWAGSPAPRARAARSSTVTRATSAWSPGDTTLR